MASTLLGTVHTQVLTALWTYNNMEHNIGYSVTIKAKPLVQNKTSHKQIAKPLIKASRVSTGLTGNY